MYKKLIVTLLVFVMTAVSVSNGIQPVHAQAVAGDAAFIGYNANGNDDLALVLFRGMTVGAVIYITDDEWTGAAFDSFSEGTLKWTNNTAATIPAGTVLIFSNVDNLGGGTNPIGVNIGLLEVDDAGMAFIPFVGDIVYAYMGTRVTPQFMAAATSMSLGFTDNGGTLAGTGLTEDTTAINLYTLHGNVVPKEARYDGSRIGNLAMSDYLTDLNTAANWAFNDTVSEILPFDDTAFTGTPTAITFSALEGEDNRALPVFLISGVVLLLIIGSFFVLQRSRRHSFL